MPKSVVVATGCDANFYPYMADALKSLAAINIDVRADIGVLDLGLTQEQVNELTAMGCTVKKPTWSLSIPQELQVTHQIGLVARTALRDYFPGYKTYLWFDADAWAQTPEFFDALVDGANAKGIAVIRENGANYKRDLMYTRWWFGNMVATYGLVKGLGVAWKPAMNIGIMALSDTAPHWDAWIQYYQQFIQKRGKVNNQHAFNAAVELEKLPYAQISARNNWICTLSDPVWNPETKLLCEPNKAALPISVIHMAGPRKDRMYNLKQIGGGTIETQLTYPAICALQAGEVVPASKLSSAA